MNAERVGDSLPSRSCRPLKGGTAGTEWTGLELPPSFLSRPGSRDAMGRNGTQWGPLPTFSTETTT